MKGEEEEEEEITTSMITRIPFRARSKSLNTEWKRAQSSSGGSVNMLKVAQLIADRTSRFEARS